MTSSTRNSNSTSLKPEPATTAQLLATAHLDAVKHWDAEAEKADRAGRSDLAERYRSRGDENWLLARNPAGQP